ncbi:MAG: CesD/SycD/LcrH family type III secretion system chaperone, partial [Thaumarchaeota archaeon S15]
AAYDRAIEIEPNHAEAHAGRAAALDALGREPEAEEAWRLAGSLGHA